MDSKAKKATVQEIRARFDADVERFSNPETGQSATIDAPLVLELIAQSAAAVNPHATSLLDIGCGAGNFSLKLIEVLPELRAIILIDLSERMLERAQQRISIETRALLGDIRDIELPQESFDVVVAAAVLHHLRADAEWEAVFLKIYRCLRPGGSFWVADLVEHSIPAVQDLMWQRYGEYLAALKGSEYRDHVFRYVQYEDTPRSLLFQTELLKQVGFGAVDVLHKNGCFAAFCALKGFTGRRAR